MPPTKRGQWSKTAPKTRSTTWSKPKSKSVTVANEKAKEKLEDEMLSEVEETAYEALLRKVNEKRRKEETGKSKTQPMEVSDNSEDSMQNTSARFIEDDNYVTMNVTAANVHKEFPNEEDDGDIYSLSSQEMESQNNNAAVMIERSSRTGRSPSTLLGHMNKQSDGEVPCSSKENPIALENITQIIQHYAELHD